MAHIFGSYSIKPDFGVATKYLESYLGWRRMIDRDGDDLAAVR